MKIGIDASRLRVGMTGIGRYIESILAPLDRELPDATFVLYSRRECSALLPSARWSVRYDRHPVFSRLPTTQWIHYRLGSLVKSDGLDVFWATNTLAPRGLAKFVPRVTTVYDLIHLLVPETLTPLMRFAYQRWFDADVRTADRVVAISRGTSRRLEERLGRHADAVALPAIPLLPFNRELATQTLAALGVQKPFLLTVGAHAPRKNLASALAAVKLLKARGELTDYQLVMAGAQSYTGDDRFIGSAEDGRWIKPIGYIDDLVLAALYASTEAFIFPSLYEGYGMPVAEARSLGCRVITTDSPELREAGDAEVTYVEPTPLGIASGLKVALSRPRPSSRRLEHDWVDAAKVMAQMLVQAASEGRKQLKN